MSTSETSEIDDATLERNWQEYVNNFLSDPLHANEVKAYEVGNILIPENRNVIEHQLMAGLEISVLCDTFGVNGEERQTAVTAGNVHDFNVIREKIAKRNKEIKNFSDLKKIKDEDSLILKEIGFPETVTSLTDQNITQEGGGPYDLTGMFIFLADACLSGKEIVDYQQRFELTRKGWRSDKGVFDEKTAEENRHYFEDVFKDAPGHNGRPHDEVQLVTTERICRELVQRMKEMDHPDTQNLKYSQIFSDDGDPTKFPIYLKEKVKEKIMSLGTN